jgi:hypothetical protein
LITGVCGAAHESKAVATAVKSVTVRTLRTQSSPWPLAGTQGKTKPEELPEGHELRVPISLGSVGGVSPLWVRSCCHDDVAGLSAKCNKRKSGVALLLPSTTVSAADDVISKLLKPFPQRCRA